MNEIGDFPYKNYGWICPKCGQVYSPNITTCPCNKIGVVKCDNGDEFLDIRDGKKSEPISYYHSYDWESFIKQIQSTIKEKS